MKSGKPTTPKPEKDEWSVSDFANHAPAWGGLLLGGLGFIVSIYSIYLQSYEVRELTVVVADRGTGTEVLNLSVTFNNRGDTTEVVTDVVLRLMKNNERDIFFSANLDPCLEPVIVSPNSAAHRAYQASIPGFATSLRGIEYDLPQTVFIDFYTSHSQFSPRRTTVRAGTIYRDPITGRINSSSIYAKPERLRLTGYSVGEYEAVRKLPKTSACPSGAL